MRLSDLFAIWLRDYARMHCKSWKEFQRQFELYLSSWADRQLDTIRRHDVVALHAQLARERGKSAANKAVELLSMLYNRAIEWELFDGRNPAERVRKFRIQPRERFLQPDELPRFLSAVQQLRNPTTRDFFLMLLFTGQRRRNVAEMQWDQIDFERAVWRIPRTKNGSSHLLPLTEESLTVLRRRQGCHAVWVFPREDGTGPIWCRWTAWKRLLAKSGLSDLRMHDLRRTLASWQAATGAPLPVIGATLAHRDPKSTAIYARMQVEPVRVAMGSAIRAMLSCATVPLRDL